MHRVFYNVASLYPSLLMNPLRTEKLEALQEQPEVGDEVAEVEESEGKLEPLTEKQHNEVPTAVEVFGMEWVGYHSV